MKIRITPLNVCTALFLVAAVYLFINGAKIIGSVYTHWTGTIALIFVVFAIATSFLDMILRNFFPETKRLWIIELSFIVLTAVIFLIVK